MSSELSALISSSWDVFQPFRESTLALAYSHIEITTNTETFIILITAQYQK